MRIQRPSGNQIARAVKVVGFLLVLSAAIYGNVSAATERASNHALTDILRRRSPVTDYTQAEFGHTDCRKNYEDAYLAAVGRALTAPSGDPSRAAAFVAVGHYTDILANIESNCPTPVAPVFGDDGLLLIPPIIPSTTTSTTQPPPETTSVPSG